MNYVRHLNGFFRKLEQDERMSAYHISLYLSCFQLWNLNRFKDSFQVSRMEMMRLARIGSVNTYAKCIKELHEWGYVRYSASSNYHRGSILSCISFETSGKIGGNTAGDTTYDTTCNTASDTLLINNTNNKNEGASKRKFKNKRQKNPLDATTGKDYAEPL